MYLQYTTNSQNTIEEHNPVLKGHKKVKQIPYQSRYIKADANKLRKTCSTIAVIKKMHTKMTVKY